MTDEWVELGALEPVDLVDAALELHWAVQLIAAAGQTFAEPAEDDSHRAMVWEPTLRAFVGAPFAGPYPLRVGIRPADLTLVVLDRTDADIADLPLPGRSLDEAHEWLGLAAATYFGGAPPVLERPRYDMPTHPIQHGARFSTAIARERSVLAALYGSAARLIGRFARGRAEASEVRCWPHHFDIATLLTLEQDESGKATKTVGVGLAPGGDELAHWYWYFTPWPAPAEDRLPALSRGAWHAEGWTGAVLAGDVVVSLPAGRREQEVESFVRSAVTAARTSLA